MDQVKRHILNIDSDDRSSGTPENFILHLNESEFHEVKYIQLKDIAFANTMYNIKSSNNQLRWEDSFLVQYSLTIPIGYYSSDELVIYINSTNPAVNPTSPIQLVANTKIRKFTITNTAPFHLLTTSTILKVIGFSVPNQSNLLSHSASEMYNFLVTPYVHVLSSTLSEADSLVSSNGKKYAVIATIPVNVPFGFMVNVNEEKTSSDESIHNANINLSTIDIRLVDSNFQTIELNGSPVIMNFTVSRS